MISQSQGFARITASPLPDEVRGIRPQTDTVTKGRVSLVPDCADQICFNQT